MERQILIIRGAPGSGKSSLGRRMKKKYTNGVLIEVDHVRGMMNNLNWEDERQHFIALEVVAASVKTFQEHKISPIIIVDMFMPDKLKFFIEKFDVINFKVISLLVNEKVLQKRLEDRKEGFKNLEKGIQIGKLIQEHPCEQELVIDTSELDKNKISEKSLAFLNGTKND